MRASVFTSGWFFRLFCLLTFLGSSLPVAAKPPMIDTKRTGTGSKLSQTELDQLPAGRRPWEILQQAPGVLADRINIGGPPPANQFTVAGPLDSSNVFLVDGVVVNEQTGKTPGLFIEDAIQETSVLRSAFSPEYGRFAGGVVNVITRSGGNQTSGSLRFDFINGAPTSGAAKMAAGGDGEKYTATLGGPLVKDRLWFSSPVASEYAS
jgi:outer membrane receptor for ferrienterochelin and colicin